MMISAFAKTSRGVLLAAVLLVVGLALPLVAFYWVGSAQAQREAQSRRATEVASRLEALRAVEARRPWYHYQRLYHEPRAIDNGASLLPSPLQTEPRDPSVASWFSIGKDGEPTSPSDDDDRALPAIVAAKGDLLAAASIGSASGSASASASGSGSASASPSASSPAASVAMAHRSSEAQVLTQNAYYQNTNPQVVYTDLTTGNANANFLATGEVTVRVAAMSFHVVVIDQVPELVGIRVIQTPDGALTQGFVVRRASLGEDVKVLRAADARTESAVGVPIQNIAGGLVEIDPRAASSSSMNAFHRKFFPIAAIALMAGACVLLVLMRSERLAQERARFAAVAAHELRTPLAGLRLYAEMLAEDLGDPTAAQQYARRIADESARLSRVVSNVLGFTRLEHGVLTVQAEKRSDLATVVRAEIERMKPGIANLDAKLVDDAVNDVGPCVFDADAVTQILQNLVDNAEKYGRGAEDRTIRVALTEQAEQGCVALTVEDRGPGIDASLSPRLFEPFTRGASTDAPAGVGLGLSIGSALAQAQKGKLTHTPRSGGGSVFTLTLPRSASESESESESESVSESASSARVFTEDLQTSDEG
jgi:signal transduction histidine kinase